MSISGIGGVTPSFGPTSQTPSASPSTPSASSSSQASSASSEVYYSSPVFTLDAQTGSLIQEWRDTKTGDELYQSPTRAALLYGKTADSPGGASTPATGQTSSKSGGGASFLA